MNGAMVFAVASFPAGKAGSLQFRPQAARVCPCVFRERVNVSNEHSRISGACLQNHGTFPSVMDAFPQTSDGFPATVGGFPESLRAFPKTIRAFAESFYGFPEWFRMFQKLFYAFPKLFGEFPEAFRAFVESFYNLPESFREHEKWSGKHIFALKLTENAKNSPFSLP
jgi:hypothetical protein